MRAGVLAWFAGDTANRFDVDYRSQRFLVTERLDLSPLLMPFGVP